MTRQLIDERDDATLIEAVRAGDQDAFGPLYQRHSPAALRLAHQLNRNGADDLVAEAFARVLAQLRAGKGPDLAFRTYLLTTLRRHHYDLHQRGRREFATEEESVLDQSVPFEDAAELGFERSATARAFSGLSERWQTVLWHVEVEGETPASVAPLLGLTPNAVSALLVRARDALREAYLQEHVSPTTDESCRAAIGVMASYVRGRAPARARATLEHHVDHCRSCFGLVIELREMNAGLAAFIAPAVLGSAAVPFCGGSVGLSSSAATTSRAAAAVGVGGAAAAVVVATSIAAFSVGDHSHVFAGPVAQPATNGAPPTEPIPMAPGEAPTPIPSDDSSTSPTPSDSATTEPGGAETSPTHATPTAPGPTSAAPPPRPTTPAPTPTPEPSPTPDLPVIMGLNVWTPVLVTGSNSADRVVELTVTTQLAADSSPRTYRVTFNFTQPPGLNEPGGQIVASGDLFDSCDPDTGRSVTCTLTLEPGVTRTGQVAINDSDEGGFIDFTSIDSTGESQSVPFSYPSVRG